MSELKDLVSGLGPFWDMLAKLFLAVLVGGLIGAEREMSHKPAGFRTHMAICVGSTVLMLVSIGVALTYHVGDPTRIASGVMSGIGFLGAGAIIQSRRAVHGLTTAATIWAVAGLGLAIGAGLYGLALVATLILLIVLHYMTGFEHLLYGARPLRRLQVVVGNEGQLRVEAWIAEAKGETVSFKRVEGGVKLTVDLHLTRDALTRWRHRLEHDADVLAVEILDA